MQTATYKGKTYKLLFCGHTKFGTRAHLSFLDGSKDFWVDASLVSEGSATNSSRSPGRDYPGKECPACGSEDLDARLHCWECGYTGKR